MQKIRGAGLFSGRPILSRIILPDRFLRYPQPRANRRSGSTNVQRFPARFGPRAGLVVVSEANEAGSRRFGATDLPGRSITLNPYRRASVSRRNDRTALRLASGLSQVVMWAAPGITTIRASGVRSANRFTSTGLASSNSPTV